MLFTAKENTHISVIFSETKIAPGKTLLFFDEIEELD